VAPPRTIRPGLTYLLTRRCNLRAFRLRPSEQTNQIFRYCLALAAAKTGVELHAVCVMSNHHHVVLTDVQGRLPDFARELHRLTAKAMNASQGQWEILWSAEQCHFLELGDDDAVVRRIAYLAANPVEAGLVATPDDWPGVMLLPRDHAYTESVARPKAYFGETSKSPAEIELHIVPPSRIENLLERVANLLEQMLAKAHAAAREHGWQFLGRAGVLATSFVRRARSLERRRQTVPRVAARSMFIRQKLLAAQREFRRAYHAAIDAWRDGKRDTVFPEGTWWMRVFHGVAVGGAWPAAA
jgi:REP element-mobilizing transposase RayT